MPKPNKDASCMGSCRPIALICMTCKLMERIILRRITFHLMNHNMLPQEQYGLARDILQSTKYSTLSNGLEMHTIYEAFQRHTLWPYFSTSLRLLTKFGKISYWVNALLSLMSRVARSHGIRIL
ncbi:hypothetical protein CEXT_648821 [Caerostris extrusa]|uniref:Uncharacterized protein n=1 Tax=Caerostris extrusa TaxID=172846 RepID=A0AAV4PPX0_CAEEX|nr:hypothetical protein CEXT_648821 [Caerostris extrusa]